MFQLRDYQVDISNKGIAILKQHGLVCYAVEVRCGKTLMALNTALLYGAKNVLFLTKLKAIGSIRGDFEKLKPSYNLYVVNYEQAHTLNPKDFDLVICDECHQLSAFPKPSERTKIVKKVADGKPVIYLSGTFTPESYSQIYHILWTSSFSPFREYKNFYAWAKDGFVTIKQKQFHGVPVNDYKLANKEKIDHYTKHLFISFTQAEAGFQQMVQEHILKVKMKDSTYWLAKKLVKDRVHVGKNGEEIIADTAVKLQNKLHQVFSGTVKAEDGTRLAFDSTKADFIAETFKGKRIAIFYKFKAELELIRWAFKGKITEDIEVFKKGDCDVIAYQVQSGSMGTNLSMADVMVMYNIDFSNLLYWQVRARMQTLNRAEAVNVYWVFAEGGIEEKVLKAVQNKTDYVQSYFIKDFNIKPIKKTA